MNVLYASLIVLIVYPVVGTLLFAFVENLKTSIKIKITVITFGHPFLAGAVIWFVCSTFNKDIAVAGAMFIAGTLLWTPFSERTYFSTVAREPGAVTIEYFSELLIRKSIRFSTSQINDFAQSTSHSLVNKPSILTVSYTDQIFKFTILDKTVKVSDLQGL